MPHGFLLLQGLLLLLSLSGCAAWPPEKAAPSASEGAAVTAQGTSAPQDSPAPPDWEDPWLGFPEAAWQPMELEQRPYADWVFSRQPYLLEGDSYWNLYRCKYLSSLYEPESGGHAICTAPSYSPQAPGWYGVPDCFPFVGLSVTGMAEGLDDSPEGLCDEAMAIARRYYSAACGYSAPDGTAYVKQVSNYPQFSYEPSAWEALAQYRWFWELDDEAAEACTPRQPEPYTGPIQLQVAEMNWNAGGWFPAQTERDYQQYDALTLAEQTALQNQWMSQWFSGSGREVPESERYYAITGLTVLNGDSQTEASYFAGSRARDIRITVNGSYIKEITLQDSPAPQLIDLTYTQHTIAEPVEIQIEILSVYPGSSGSVYITEIGVGIDSNLDQGI